MELNSKSPTGPIETRWDRHRFNLKLVNPANKRKYTIIVVGTGLAGGAAAASLAELGYNVDCFCFQDSPRRAHSIAAQGGINAAKNYHNDGDSVYRLFYDTVKGGDFRARESNVYRLAGISLNIIDQCVAQGVPFAREYSGYLDNRSFGGAQVSRTFYARGQTGQQLLLGAYQALERQIGLGTVKMYPRTEMLDLIVVDGRARGIVTRDLITGKIQSHFADAVVLGTGGYGNVYYLSTNAKGCNTTAIWRAHKPRRPVRQSLLHPDSPHLHSRLRRIPEQAHPDERIAAQRRPRLGALKKGDKRAPSQIPDAERDYFLERKYPSFGNLVPRDVASRNAKAACDEGRGVGETGLAVYLDFRDAIQRLGAPVIKERYGNLFDMYNRITGEDPYKEPMRIYPAIHYTMGGLWVDYNLMSNVPGLYVIGEANFSDHGANRLGASALMQGLADGYFVLPNTIGDYLASNKFEKVDAAHAAAREAEANVQAITRKLLEAKGKRSVDSYHRELGKIMWEQCGMARNASGLKQALSEIPALREQYWRDVKVLGTGEELNQSLEKAGRVADFFELAELMCRDALDRNESCGGHFREEYQTPEGEAARDDEHFAYAAAWGFQGAGQPPVAAQRAADFRIRAPLATELQVMRIILHIWRQRNSSEKGKMVRYEVPNVNHEMSFLEMLDVLNEDLIAKNEEPVAFDHDCREGICGMCGCMVNGMAHGPLPGTTLCQLHMRHFKDGDELYLEPWRAAAFPVVKDLVVDRTAFDRIIAAGGYISVATGSAPDGNSVLIPKDNAERSMDAAACIGCGACVATCPNASAALFTGAKIAHLGLLPQGQPEREQRAIAMVAQAKQELFGSCTNIGECEAVCPKEIKLEVIARMNKDFIRASLNGR